MTVRMHALYFLQNKRAIYHFETYTTLKLMGVPSKYLLCPIQPCQLKNVAHMSVPHV